MAGRKEGKKKRVGEKLHHERGGMVLVKNGRRATKIFKGSGALEKRQGEGKEKKGQCMRRGQTLLRTVRRGESR